MKILNLTQHSTSLDQKKVGVIDLLPNHLKSLKELLTFTEVPAQIDLEVRAYQLVQMIIENYSSKRVMIGGAPFFMPHLERELKEVGIQPMYAFSKREASEKDGVKTSTFQHKGFVMVKMKGFKRALKE